MKPKFIRFLLILIAFIILVPVVLGSLFTFLVYSGSFGSIPDESDLRNIKNATASVILDRNFEPIGRIYDENRTTANFKEFPEHLVQALIATEDARFFEHEGIDARSIARVLVKSVIMGDRSAGGGSTISQQLAKNLFGREDHGALSMPVSKLKEMIIATRLETIYSKEELIELYLNTVPFSENVYGIETAAERFFSTEISQLSIERSAVLIGMLKANTYYNPRLHPDHALTRRNIVLGQMHRYDYLNEAQADSLSKLPLGLEYNNPGREGLAAYYLVQVRREVQKILLDRELLEEYDPRSSGLIIETGLDLELQKLAEQAYDRHLNSLQQVFDKHWGSKVPWQEYSEIHQLETRKTKLYKSAKARGLAESEMEDLMHQPSPSMMYYPGGDTVLNLSPADSISYYLRLLRSGFVALNPQSGAVLSWIGGRDINYMPYDHVLARRQAASTFKPIVYAAGLEEGMDPCSYWENEKRRYSEHDDWTPENYDNEYGGYYSTAGALKNSVNVAAVQALFKIGVDDVRDLASEMGIKSDLPKHPSLALGSASVSVLEMAQAYAVFASGGQSVQAYFVSRIKDAEGKILYERPAEEIKVVLSEENAVLMTEMLKKVVNEGTGSKLRTEYGVKMDLAGKTGTSQDYSDAWFVAYNPGIVAACWVGGAYPIIRFRSGVYGSSSRQALPMLAEFYRSIERNGVLTVYRKDFPEVSDQLMASLDCPDFREKTFFDGVRSFFGNQEGEKIDEKEDDSPGFFKRLFGKGKDKEGS